MDRLAKFALLVVLVLVVNACGPAADTSEPPQLVSAVTIAPGTKGAILPTPTPTLTPSDTPTETLTPTDVPTETPSPTWTFTDVPTDTLTFTPTPTVYVSPTRTLRPTRTVTPSASPPTLTPQTCEVNWFFSPRPPDCPMSMSSSSPAAFQQFEHGIMIWAGSQNTIYVIYDAKKAPRWAQYPDTWKDGMPDSDPSLVPPSGMIQPIRGFGLVWRGKRGVRDKLGWATGPEMPFQGDFQLDTVANRYVEGAHGEVYELSADFKSWQLVRG